MTAPAPPLRLLHIAAGFRPFRRGGLIAYVEDLMAEQVARGHDVTYLCAGRQWPGVPGPRVKRWRNGRVPVIEVVNSPLYDHGHQPALEVTEPRVEAIVARAVREVRPDAVHVHELAGLPSSVLDVVRDAGVPVVFTLQDYFPLCPAFKLSGRRCMERDVGADCVATVAGDGRDPALLYDATVRHALHWRPPFTLLGHERRARLVGPLGRAASAPIRRRGRREDGDAATYGRRRALNVERLSRVDRLIAMSHRVAEIYAVLGVAPERIRTMQLTLAHIEKLRPRVRTAAADGGPVTFATLGGGESPEKGSRVLLGAVRRLSETVDAGSFRVLLFGWPDAETAAAARDLPAIEVRKPFAPQDLDRMLDEVDVGIMPSTWEEAYGYAGVEFLAKGIPVIANAIGGMVDYVRDGETGWLNRGLSADGLAAIMAGIVERPAQVAELNARIRAHRDAIVLPMARHADRMDDVYRELVSARSAAPAPS